MAHRTPLFHGFNRLIGGRKSLPAITRILREQHPMDVLCASQLQALFASFLPADLLNFKFKTSAKSSARVYTPTVTFWAFLGQVLDPTSSCIKAVSRVQALFTIHKRKVPSLHTGAYCDARLRLSLRWMVCLLEHLTTRLCLGQPEQGRLLVVDGTSVALPDTAALQHRYPQPGGQKPGCGFPIMKLLGLFDLHSGAWLATTHSSRMIHDSRLWRRLFRRFRPGDTVIVDRAFCSYFDLTRLMAQGVDVVVRLHQKRHSDFRTGKRLGRQDHLVIWNKPPRPRWMSQSEYAARPDHIVVREVRHQVEMKSHRTRSLDLVTTLIDEQEHSREQVAALYAKRWRVELNFDDIKTTMSMEMLRTKSVAMVSRELVMHMIAYNLMRALMWRSGADPARVSFKGAVNRVQTWQWVIWLAPTRREAGKRTEELLKSIATHVVHERPRFYLSVPLSRLSLLSLPLHPHSHHAPAKA